jgi:hypothetical protein
MRRRIHESGICTQGFFESTGSQISILSSGESSTCVHWFTTGSDPSLVCYKPFSFAENGGIGTPDQPGAAADLWREHKKVKKNIRSQLMALEDHLLAQVREQVCATSLK